MELDQLWLGTKERTEKLPMNSIKAVVSEAIKGQEEYHIMALQLGPTEASRSLLDHDRFLNTLKTTPSCQVFHILGAEPVC